MTSSVMEVMNKPGIVVRFLARKLWLFVCNVRLHDSTCVKQTSFQFQKTDTTASKGFCVSCLVNYIYLFV